jgi:hypothetical protein
MMIGECGAVSGLTIGKRKSAPVPLSLSEISGHPNRDRTRVSW